MDPYATSQTRERDSKNTKFKRNAISIICQNQDKLVAESRWQVELPVPPKVPLLYEHEGVEEAFAFGSAILQCDIDAMAFNVLDDLPVIHYCNAPWDEMTKRDFVAKNHAKKTQRLDQDEKDGKPKALIPDPMKDNPELEQGDLDLIDTDIHETPINQRSLPSLSLFRAPIYTEAGAIPPEKRAQMRLVRRLSQHVDDFNASFASGDAALLSPSFRGSQGSLRNTQQAATSVDDVKTQWKKDIAATFKNAKSLDSQFLSFVRKVASSVLQLKFPAPADDPNDHAAFDANARLTLQIEQLTQEFLRLLTSKTASTILEAVRMLLVYKAEGGGAVEFESIHSYLEEGLDAATVLAAMAWFEDYAALVTDVSKVPSDLLHVLNQCHGPNTAEGGRVVLCSGSDPSAFPTSVRPLVPASDAADYPEAEANPLEGSLSALLFRGGRPRTFRRGETHILLPDNTLYYPTFRDDEVGAAATRYEGDYSAFQPFLENRHAKNRILLSFGQREVGFQRIPRTVEYVRQTNSGISDPTKAPQYLVVWNDEEDRQD